MTHVELHKLFGALARSKAQARAAEIAEERALVAMLEATKGRPFEHEGKLFTIQFVQNDKKGRRVPVLAQVNGETKKATG